MNIMKKINIFLLTFLIVAVSTISCTEQLTETVYSELLAGNAYETENDAQALVTSVYSGMRGADWGTYYEYDYMMISESSTDTYGIDDWEAGEQMMEIGTWDNNFSFIVNMWDGAYKIIGAANFALKILVEMDIDDAVKNRLIGETKFLRALAYYDLGFNFGDVILNTSAEDSENKGLSPQAEVLAQVLADLTDAIALLGESSSPGRASKGAALGLRAKTHLNMKNWTEAAADAQLVMGLGLYELEESVEDAFDLANLTGNEWIFSYLSSTAGGAAPSSQMGWFSLGFQYQNGGWGRLSLAPEFYKSFDMADERRNLMGNGYQFGNMSQRNGKDRWAALEGTPEYDAVVADTATTKDLWTLQSLTCTKYLAGHDRFTYRSLGSSGVNYPILRYADILLTRAEALNEGSGQGEALTLVNQVRARSNVAPLAGLGQNALRDAIFDERAKELFMEGHRRLDLVRSGNYIRDWKANLETKYPGRSFEYLNEDRTFFPIPQKELDANDMLMTGE